MPKIRLAIVGCGGMGHRHLFGLVELDRAGWDRFELVAVCDPLRENAESLAQEAANHFETRPRVVTNLDELAAAGVEALDVTAPPRHHHTVIIDALNRGWHIMVEKPMGLTVQICHLIREAAQNSGSVVSVAENYRRDPLNRLARALLDAGVIGEPRLLRHLTIGGGDGIFATVWRHHKDQSGMLVDMGVHYADMMEYLLGEISTVYAQTSLHEPIRRKPRPKDEEPAAGPAAFYQRWRKKLPDEVKATAEDAAYATILFKSGAVGQYVEDHAGHGQPIWIRQIFGSNGSLDLPHDRSGNVIKLKIGADEPISDERLLQFVPDFQLDEVTAALYGGNRLWRYDLPFPEIDRKNIAIEYAEFAGAILGEQIIEVDVTQGARSVAIAYALLESNELGRAVTVNELLTGQIEGYQRAINDSLGI